MIMFLVLGARDQLCKNVTLRTFAFLLFFFILTSKFQHFLHGSRIVRIGAQLDKVAGHKSVHPNGWCLVYDGISSRREGKKILVR